MLSLFIKISETYKMQQRRIEVKHVVHNPTQTTHVMSIAVRFISYHLIDESLFSHTAMHSYNQKWGYESIFIIISFQIFRLMKYKYFVLIHNSSDDLQNTQNSVTLSQQTFISPIKTSKERYQCEVRQKRGCNEFDKQHLDIVVR